VLVARSVYPRQVNETPGEILRGPGSRPANRDRLFEPGLCLVQPAEIERHLSDHVEQAGVNDRLIGEVVGLEGAPLKQVERGQLRGGDIAGLTGAEQLQEETGDPVRLGEGLFRTVALARGAASLQDRDAQPDHQRGDHGRRCRNLDPMAPHEFPNPIPAPAPMRHDRQTGEVPFDVLTQHVDRCVTTARLLAHRHHHDAIEVAFERSDSYARPDRILFADERRHLQRRSSAEAVRRAATQQLVEQHA
jgi:hypothetical protein